MKDFLKSTAVRAVGFAAALISLIIVSFGVLNWFQDVNAQLAEHERKIEEGSFSKFLIVRDEAINQLNTVSYELQSAMQGRFNELNAIKVEISEQYAEKVKEIEALRQEVNKSFNAERTDQDQKISEIRLKLSEDIDVAVVEFGNELSRKLARARAELDQAVSNEADRFTNDLASVDKAKRQIDEIYKDVSLKFNTLIGEQERLKTDADNYDRRLRTYQSFVENRMDKLESVPAGTLIFHAGTGTCPSGFSSYSRALMFFPPEHSEDLKTGDFVADSSWDLFAVINGGVKTLGFSQWRGNQILTQGNPSYDARVVKVCRRR